MQNRLHNLSLFVGKIYVSTSIYLIMICFSNVAFGAKKVSLNLYQLWKEYVKSKLSRWVGEINLARTLMANFIGMMEVWWTGKSLGTQENKRRLTLKALFSILTWTVSCLEWRGKRLMFKLGSAVNLAEARWVCNGCYMLDMFIEVFHNLFYPHFSIQLNSSHLGEFYKSFQSYLH